MTQKIAIITQSYKNDYNECKLLCESIDRFSPELDHFIFVNDEDIKLFQSLKYGKHKVYKKQPSYLGLWSEFLLKYWDIIFISALSQFQSENG